jgi:hypothetical protein
VTLYSRSAGADSRLGADALSMSGGAKFWPVASASPAPRRTRQVPLTGSRLRGTATMNDLTVRSTVRLPPWARMSVRNPVTGLISQAPRLETTSAWSMPGERTPACAGQAAAPVAGLSSVSSVHSAMGMLGSASVTQSTRQ